MKGLRRLSRVWKGVLVTSIILPLGCAPKSTPKLETPLNEMHTLLQRGICKDERIAMRGASAPAALPSRVQEALRPNFTTSGGTSIVGMPEKRFDLSADQVPAKVFFMSLVQDTPYNITVHPGVDGKISLQMKKVTVREVLNTVRNVYGYDYRQTPQGIEILPASIQTRAFPINYLDLNRKGKSEVSVLSGGESNGGSAGGGATPSTTSGGSGSGTTAQVSSKITTETNTDFWNELVTSVNAIIGSGAGRSVAASPLSSILVVQAMPNELRRVEEYLRSAEISLNRQVILDAKVLEVTLNEKFQAGINWDLVSGKMRLAQVGGNAVKTPGILSELPSPVSPFNQPINIAQGLPTFEPATNVGSFGGVFALAMNYKNLAAFVELLETQGNVQVLSSPRVSTTNNQKALIKVGTDSYFVTNVSSSTTVVPGTTAAQTTPNVTFDSFFSGIALDVTPHITQNDVVTLHIHPRVSNVQNKDIAITLGNQQQIFPLADTQIREADSIVRARNGELVVIGGLMKDQASTVRTGIPVLKNIPGLGKLFRHTYKQINKSELVILLRPIIVDNSTWVNELGKEEARLRQLDGELHQRCITSTCLEGEECCR